MPIADEQIQKWIDTGKVVPAPIGCQWNLPIPIAQKRDYVTGEKKPGRTCIDPRALNEQLKPDRFPTPLSFLQLRIHPDHQQKVAFTWRGRHLMFVGVPFGLKPTSSAPQRVMQTIFHESTIVRPFQDDCTMGSDSAEQHAVDALTKANMRANWVKSRIFPTPHTPPRSDIHRRRHPHRRAEDSGGNVTWPVPVSGNQVEKFLGLINDFRDFISAYSTIAAPLEALRKTPILSETDWSTSCQAVFDALKNILSEATSLSFPDFKNEFRVATHASNVGIAATIYQLDNDERLNSSSWPSSLPCGSSTIIYGETHSRCLQIIAH